MGPFCQFQNGLKLASQLLYLVVNQHAVGSNFSPLRINNEESESNP